MANIVQMDEPLTFGKRQGWTGKQLLEDPSGCNYLAWVYENTDIQMDGRIVGVLKLMGLVEFKRIRLNSIIDGKRTVLNESQRAMVQDNINKLRQRLAITPHDNLTGRLIAAPGSFNGELVQPVTKERVDTAFEKAIRDTLKKESGSLEPLRINCSSRYGVKVKGY